MAAADPHAALQALPHLLPPLHPRHHHHALPLPPPGHHLHPSALHSRPRRLQDRHAREQPRPARTQRQQVRRRQPPLQRCLQHRRLGSIRPAPQRVLCRAQQLVAAGEARGSGQQRLSRKEAPVLFYLQQELFG